MSETLKISREFIANDLILRREKDGTIGSIGAWITVDGQDVLVHATHEDFIEDSRFHDDTPQRDPAQLAMDL